MTGRSVLSLSRVLQSWLQASTHTAHVLSAALGGRRQMSRYTIIPPPARYGGRHMVTLIPGDGIGPELLSHVRELFRFCCVPVDFEVVNVDSTMTSEDDINDAITAIRRNGVALKGNIETNHNLPPSFISRNNLLRTSLDLYANVMHCQSLPGVRTRHRNIDIIIIRENTEGEYSSLEHESVSGVVECLKIITRTNSLRIADYAFRLARERGRRRVTAVHKANIMKLGDGLFLQCCKEVAAGYQDIAFDAMIVDNTTMQLVSKPQQFDVMVMPNLYGNVGTRNTGKSIADGNIANPTAMLLASCLLLDHLRLHAYATMIRRAVIATVTETRLHTADLGGQGSTSDVVHSIMKEIQSTGPLTQNI
ncbi:isocitrate dehydrogenase [NAD] subunit gamma, mitochondrial isoform X5 [Salmo trutta]|uniref:isocitrate dehydrogenase [NAD] subunit gamma, mitochondrial isoform X5 n=1 Tax=Salmo trutta TaxID=8032 RepID=UPI001130F995|nr:isocitrate dehydrogenase [NAD] subunit gamma, mitochondrial-like isoform X5 [Salmo trutta]